MPEFQPGLPISLSATVELVAAETPGQADRLVLKKSLPDAPNDVMARFETAAQILPRLSTPHAPTLRASGLHADAAYLLMDWVPGETLVEVMRHGPLSEQRLVDIGAALARALHAIHRQNTVHLHLLPSHVMLTPEGRAVLLSFGLAHHRECPDLLSEGDWRAAVTSPWMAPEQLYQVRDDPRSDQWALGALLYQMAVGKPPFPEPGQSGVDGVLEDRLWKNLVPLRHLRPDLPAWLQEVVHRCLEVAPVDRFDDCAQVAWALEHPASVELDPGRARVEPAGSWQSLTRWWQHRRDPVQALKGLRRDQARVAPLVVLAIDPDAVEGELPVQLREAARRMLGDRTEAHLACLTVVESTGAGAGDGPGTGAGTGSGPALPLPSRSRRRRTELLTESHDTPDCRRSLQALRQWAKPLGLPDTRLSFHVFQGGDPLEQLLEFATDHQAAFIVIGAPAAGGPSTRWDAAALRVVEAAPCSVFLVRLQGGTAASDSGRRSQRSAGAAPGQAPPSALTR